MCSPSYACRGTPIVARMCLNCAKKLLHKLQNSTGTRTKNRKRSRNEAAKPHRKVEMTMWLVGVVSGCGQWVWLIGVISACGQWVWSVGVVNGCINRRWIY